MKRAPLFVLTALVGLSAVASAATTQDARFALHVKPSGKNSTYCTTYTPNADGLPCTQYNTAAQVGAYQLVYIVVGQGSVTEGITGCSFGIDYNGRTNGGVTGDSLGIDPQFNSFRECFDGLSFYTGGSEGLGDFPAPKGAAILTYSTCQTTDIGGIGVHAVLGALVCYAVAPDVLRLTPNNNLVGTPNLVVSTCVQTEVDFYQIVAPSLLDDILPRVEFGGTGDQGYTPCGVVPAATTTWGKVKSLY